MIIGEEYYLEHYGKKGMKWGTRNTDRVSDLGKRSQKRVARQQKYIDRLRRRAAGTASLGDKYIVGFLTTRNGAERRLSRLQTEQDLVKAGRAKTTDFLNLVYGVNLRYLNFKPL